MHRTLAICAVLSALPSVVTPQTADFAGMWSGYLETCEQIALDPRTVAAQTNFAAIPPAQYVITPDRRLAGYTVGTPENYTVIYFSEIGGKVGSTCSASISVGDIAPQDIENNLKALPNADIAGGEFPVVVPSGPGTFDKYPGYTWLVELPGWAAVGASLHVQHDGYGTLTLTAFGEPR